MEIQFQTLELNNEFADCPHMLTLIIGQDQVSYYSGYIIVLLNGRVAIAFDCNGRNVSFLIFNVEGIAFVTVIFQLHYVL